MVAFRKSFSVLAILAGLLLGSSVASAQGVNCAVSAGVPPVVRGEGLTELVGDIVLRCTGGNIGQPFLANFQVSLNTNVTSRILSGSLTEALLMIDEPGSPSTGQEVCLSPSAAANTSFAVPCNAGPGPTPGGLQNGTWTIFRGETTALFNTIVWAGIPIIPAGTTGERVIRITNLRANAAAIGPSSTLIPSQITAFISVSPSNTISIDNPTQLVAYIQRGLDFAVRNCTNTGGGNPGFAQCTNLNIDVFNDPNRGGSTATDPFGGFAVRFTEGFQTAFKRRIEPLQDISRPGDIYNSESGFVRPELGAVGLANSATRIAARFQDIPADIRLFVSVENVNPAHRVPAGTGSTGFIAGAPNARLVQAGPNGEGGTFGSGTGQILVPVTATTNLSCNNFTPIGPADTPSRNAAEITVTSGRATAVWEVTDANQSQIDTLLFWVAAAYRAVPATPSPAVGQARVAGTFAPWYADGESLTSAAGRWSSVLPIPRFDETTDLQNAFSIIACETNLLFPFVTNQAGFDTGIAISNTSADPFANPQNRRQGGRCTINYFGGVTGGGAAPNPQTTNADVASGGQLLFVVSSGGNLGIAGTPGFQGYIIARCLFRYAHGFAFITDGPIGQARVAEGYLALVLDGGVQLNRTDIAAERLDN